MVQFGRFIRKIERLQSPHPLFFLAENVWLKGDDLEAVREAFGFDWDPVLIDALYFSPTRRKRHFFTNIPLINFDYGSDLSEVSPQSCLEDGFCVPAHFIEPNLAVKANCLMASKTRIDERSSLRMYVFKNAPNFTGNYHGRPMKICEREALMGYRTGYVETPGECLLPFLALARGNAPKSVLEAMLVLTQHGILFYFKSRNSFKHWSKVASPRPTLIRRESGQKFWTRSIIVLQATTMLFQ